MRDESGAVIAIVALSLIALIGMVVISVDVGGLLVQRRYMVNANDSAALAAAQAYALKEGGASCGAVDAPAQSAADQLANSNVAGSTRLSYQADCTEQTVAVEYQKPQDLFFAPVLGFGNTANVSATATALWGEAKGGNPEPVELDPNLVNNCVYVDPSNPGQYKDPGPCPTGFWFNNQDLTNSGWGLMNLSTWSATPNTNCNNAGGANALGGWITQTDPISVQITSQPMYVCTTDGGKSPNWDTDLASMKGGIFLFPVNDPSKMILSPPSNQQYAIMWFAPMKVEAVYDVGTDTAAAIGTKATCGKTPYTFSTSGLGGTSVDLDTYSAWASWGPPASGSCPSGGTWSIPTQDPTVYDASNPNKKFQAGTDYTWDASTHVITWKKALPQQVLISFDWQSGGACPGHTFDPNAFCLVLSWAGPQLIGTDPQPGNGPAQAIQLIK